MKRVILFLGMGSCISKKDTKIITPNNNNNNSNIITTNNNNIMEKTVINSPSTWQNSGRASKDEQFFDSKAWLESDDEDFQSVNGDMSPVKQGISIPNDDHPGRRLSDLFKSSTSFNSDSKTSLKATEATTDKMLQQKSAAEATPTATPSRTTTPTTPANNKSRFSRQKSIKRCIPSLVRSLSCGERKKRSTHVAVAG